MTTAPGRPHGVPPMPERSIPALRAAIAAHTPQLLADFEANWRAKIADTYDISATPAFLARWWAEYALARNPELDRHVRDLEERAAQSAEPDKAKALLEEAAQIHQRVSLLGPGE
ncbi:hypothetical protein [Streptomyces cinnamoneus]|uniref:Uncharacterized protein n=1 Tax=Streptomyces cinnamoneus TaxID=53446 RepID=A0A918WEH8_STRCJ|nr:hypothetical protein [Streptomyces cinnamoneus]GHC38755.1 hypothetical protein GCM10010507_10460 [Streptomyces cinnamoneus]